MLRLYHCVVRCDVVKFLEYLQTARFSFGSSSIDVT